MLLERPPEYTHGLSPQDMMDYYDADLLTRHYSVATSGDAVNGDFDAVMGKKFSKDERAKAAMLYQMMRDHGFYPHKIGENGQIVWGILLKSPARMLTERRPAPGHEKDNYRAIGPMVGAVGGTVGEFA